MVVILQVSERRNMQLSSMGGILYHQLNSSEQADLHVRTLHISEPSLPSPQTTMVGGQLSTALQGIRRSAVEALYHHHPLMSSPLWWRSALRACALSETPALYDTHKRPKSPQLGFTQIGFCRTVKSRPWQVAKSGSQLSVHFRWKVETNASQILVNATLPWQQIFVLGVFSHITGIKILKRCCCLLELYWCIKSSQRV